MEGAKEFELYGNLLSKKAKGPWEKIIRAQVTCSPCRDVNWVMHTKILTKTWDFFYKCIMIHLQKVF